eukprot:scaffold4990_cov176-Amphora_coffeaeformis.AAC.6
MKKDSSFRGVTSIPALIWLCLFALCTHAFVPVSTSQSRPNTVGTTSSGFTPPGLSVAVVSSRHHASTTPLYMAAGIGGGSNLLDRFSRVMRGTLNKAVASVEDPEKIIVQAVNDMQADLIKVRTAHADATASRNRLAREKMAIDQQAQEWYGRAQLALRHGNEDLARQALLRREGLQQRAQSMQAELDLQTSTLDKLATAMQTLEGQIQQAMAQKNQLVARAKTAKTTQKVYDMLNGLTAYGKNGSNSMAAWARMEEKVEAMEAAAEASAQYTIAGSSNNKLANDSVEMKFQLLEASSSIDNELEAMKQSLRQSSNKQLPASASVDRFETTLSTQPKERVSVRIPIREGPITY